MANELKADAVLAFTRHGHMARYAAWMRPRYSPIYGLCDNEKCANELTLCWGVTPFVVEFDFINPQNTIETGVENAGRTGPAATRHDRRHHRRHFRRHRNRGRRPDADGVKLLPIINLWARSMTVEKISADLSPTQTG